MTYFHQTPTDAVAPASPAPQFGELLRRTSSSILASPSKLVEGATAVGDTLVKLSQSTGDAVMMLAVSPFQDKEIGGERQAGEVDVPETPSQEEVQAEARALPTEDA